MPRPSPQSLAMHQDYEVERETLIHELGRHGEVAAACRRANISRTTFYRWREESLEFKDLTDNAMRTGRVR